MGLDMYLTGEEYTRSYTNDGEPVERPVRDGYEVESYRLKLGYWRKFAPLHTYITSVYTPGVDDCRPIMMNEDMLRSIAYTIRKGNLPKDEDSDGYFFGSPEIWREYKKDAEIHAKVFEDAAKWLEENHWRTVEYCASW